MDTMNEEENILVQMCSFCDFRCYNNHAVTDKAYQRQPQKGPNFIIYCTHCERSYKKWNSLKHIYTDSIPVSVVMLLSQPIWA